MGQADKDKNSEVSELKKINRRYKEDLKEQDLILERLKFENDMIYKKLKKEADKRGKGRHSSINYEIGNTHDVDLNFNTKVNFVDYLQRRILGSPY
jgi:hypothetical protein